MHVGQLWQLQDETALRRIDDAARRLLTRTGCRIESEELLRRLEGAGCRIDQTGMRCYFTEGLIDKVIEHFRGTTDKPVELPDHWNPRRSLGLSGSYPHLLDWPSGERRLATRQDIFNIARMSHVLDEFTGTGRVLTCAEVDPRIEPLWTTVALAETTNKPIAGGEIFHANYIEPLIRMGEVLSGIPGANHLVAACDFFIAPLVFDRKQAECFLEKRRFGLANCPGTMPISGATAPVTIAGTVTIAVAELIAGLILGYVVNPDLPAACAVASGSLDMRTTAILFGSPEALLQDITTVQVCQRLYGIRAFAVTGYVDCKHPGLEAVFQKMFPLIAAPYHRGHRVCRDGLLSGGQDYSPVQHLLDTEIDEALERFEGRFEVSEETIALELIEQTIKDGPVNFVDKEHTLKHYKTEQWYPRWLKRDFWQGQAAECSSEHEMLMRVDRYIKDAIKSYEPPDIDPSKIRELKTILSSFEEHLGK